MTKLIVFSFGVTIGATVAALVATSASSRLGEDRSRLLVELEQPLMEPADEVLEQSVPEPPAPKLSSKPASAVFPDGSPESIVAKYAQATTWQERLPLIKPTDGLTEKMAAHYGNRPVSVDYLRIVGPGNSNISVGDVLPVSLITEAKNAYGQKVSRIFTYYLEKSPDNYKILWEPSIGWQPIGWEALRASRPTEITELQLRCKLTNNYFTVDSDEDVKQTHFELEIQPDDGNYYSPMVSYVARNSPAGNRVFQILADGKEHPLILGIQFRERPEEECTWVRHVASDRAYLYDPDMRERLIAPIDVAAIPSIGWAAFKSSRPKAITEFAFLCKLTHNYFGTATNENVKQTHYELEVRPDTTEYQLPLVAYVVRDSSAGKRIYELLEDGKPHPLVLGVQYRDQTDEDCVWVRELVSDRREVNDIEMKNMFTAPLKYQQAVAVVNEVIPFEVLEMSAQWAVNQDVLGNQTLIVPAARFRVASSSSNPVTYLQVKLVYLLSRPDGSIEVLDEDTQSVVSAGDRPLDHGLSKSVLSRSDKGYKISVDNAANIAALVAATQAEVELYYDIGQGFVKLRTEPVVKTIAD